MSTILTNRTNSNHNIKILQRTFLPPYGMYLHPKLASNNVKETMCDLEHAYKPVWLFFFHACNVISFVCCWNVRHFFFWTSNLLSILSGPSLISRCNVSITEKHCILMSSTSGLILTSGQAGLVERTHHSCVYSASIRTLVFKLLYDLFLPHHYKPLRFLK